MSEPVTLHLLRHGEPELTGRLLGSTDCGVTPGGIAACVINAAGIAADRIVASDLKRASDCARAIAPNPTIDPRWRELDFGAWDGSATTEIDPDLLAAFWEDPDAAPPPLGERWSALRTRVGAALDDLNPGTTLVVSHAGAIRAALAELCGFAYAQLWSFEIGYAALVSLMIWPGSPRVTQITAIRPCAA